MTPLRLNSLDGSFGRFLSDVRIDIGGYLEGEFIADLGFVGMSPAIGAFPPKPIRGYELLLTLSADIEPRRVVFQLTAIRHIQLMRDLKPGDKIVLKTIQIKHRTHTWHELVVNGYFAGLLGPRKVNQ